jgi:hypothetical protein
MLFVASAKAVQVNFSFQANSVTDKPLFTYDNNGTDSSLDDTLAVTAGTTGVDLSVQVEGGLSVDFNDAQFTFAADVTGISFDAGVGRFMFNLAGDFAFTTNDAQGIVSGSFDSGKLNVRALDLGNGKYRLVAGESLFSFATDGTLYTTSGPALDALTGGQTLAGFQTMHFTVTGIAEVDGGDIMVMENVPGQLYDVLESFVFNSSYSGSSELVPEPATVGLSVLGLLVLARRRKA